MEFLRVSSYEGTQSTSKVQIVGGITNSLRKLLQQQDLILVEDIIDTGTTLSHLLPLLEKEVQPKSMTICSLLLKRLREPPNANDLWLHSEKCKAKYAGFSIPNHFIIGYGLDYNELYRDLGDIWVISKNHI